MAPQADPGAFEKDSVETYPIDFDFSEPKAGLLGFPAGDNVASEVVKAYDDDGNDVTSTIIGNVSHSGQVVQVWVKAGTAKESYRIVVEATSAAGLTLRLWNKMHVPE